MIRGGDARSSLFCLFHILQTSICYGSDLMESKRHADKLYNLAKVFNHDLMLLFVLPQRQVVMNLLGFSDSPGMLRGRDMDEFLSMAGSMDGISSWIHSFGELSLACFFEDWDLAERAYKETTESRFANCMKAKFTFPCYQFFCGVLHFSSYKATKKRVYLVRAKAIIKTAAKKVKEGAIAMLPVLYFLEAEKASLTCKPDIVRQKYEIAIASALNEESFNFAGIVSERAAKHFLRTHADVAQAFLGKASRCYSLFGSPALLERVRGKSMLFEQPRTQPPMSISIKTSNK